jgi:hypothetical protein
MLSKMFKTTKFRIALTVLAATVALATAALAAVPGVAQARFYDHCESMRHKIVFAMELGNIFAAEGNWNYASSEYTRMTVELDYYKQYC